MGLMRAVHIRFGLPAVLSAADAALIKKADRIAGATEAVHLAGFNEAECRTVLNFREKPLKDIKLTPLPASEAERRFLAGFRALERAMELQVR